MNRTKADTTAVENAAAVEKERLCDYRELSSFKQHHAVRSITHLAADDCVVAGDEGDAAELDDEAAGPDGDAPERNDDDEPGVTDAPVVDPVVVVVLAPEPTCALELDTLVVPDCKTQEIPPITCPR